MKQTPATRKTVMATTGSLACALILLCTFILPAEYGWDPLRTGEALGLLALSASDQAALSRQSTEPVHDRREFHLSPFESVEFKYYLPRGASLIYHWQANGELVSDLHSEPEGAAPGFAQSFLHLRAESDRGAYRAPFAGIHGWFWQNRGSKEVTLTLAATGFSPYAIELSNDFRSRHELLSQGTNGE